MPAVRHIIQSKWIAINNTVLEIGIYHEMGMEMKRNQTKLKCNKDYIVLFEV